ncbi:MAG: four helix bundle protein [Ginsengibacter sp.]
MRNFQELSIWQRSHLFTLKIYSVTKNFPKDEMFGIISQMRRSSSSIPTNIAEGCGRNSNPEMKRFLVIATGSSSELEYQLILCKDLQYLSNDSCKELQGELIEIRKMIYAFIKNLPI